MVLSCSTHCSKSLQDYIHNECKHCYCYCYCCCCYCLCYYDDYYYDYDDDYFCYCYYHHDYDGDDDHYYGCTTATTQSVTLRSQDDPKLGLWACVWWFRAHQLGTPIPEVCYALHRITEFRNVCCPY